MLQGTGCLLPIPPGYRPKTRGPHSLAWRAIDHGAHGAPYVQTSAYACSRVGCAVRTMGFGRPGGGASLCRLPVGRGRGGVIVTGEVREKDGAAPGPWPHLLNAPIGDGVQPPPHRPGRAPPTGQLGDRPASEASGSARPFQGCRAPCWQTLPCAVYWQQRQLIRRINHGDTQHIHA